MLLSVASARPASLRILPDQGSRRWRQAHLACGAMHPRGTGQNRLHIQAVSHGAGRRRARQRRLQRAAALSTIWSQSRTVAARRAGESDAARREAYCAAAAAVDSCRPTTISSEPAYPPAATAARHGPLRLPGRAGGCGLPRRLERAAEARRSSPSSPPPWWPPRPAWSRCRSRSLSACRAPPPGPTSWRRWRSTSSTIWPWRRPTATATWARSIRSRAARRR